MGAVLFFLFIVVPLVELAVIYQVGQLVGMWWTLLALLLMSVAGAVLVKQEGLRAWRRTRQAVNEARMPAAEVLDGALVLLGGALMLTPGFVTDGVGLVLVFPVTRALINRGLRGRVRSLFGFPSPRSDEQPGHRRERRGPGQPADDVIDVEVVDIQRNDLPRPDQPEQ